MDRQDSREFLDLLAQPVRMASTAIWACLGSPELPEQPDHRALLALLGAWDHQDMMAMRGQKAALAFPAAPEQRALQAPQALQEPLGHLGP